MKPKSPVRPSIRSLSLAAAVLAIGVGALAQGAKPPPASEAELLKTIDSIGAGEANRTQSIGTLPVPGNKPKKEKDKTPSGERSKNGETEITAGEGEFDQHKHQAIFTINVYVKNPDFTVSCDKLTAFLKNNDAPAAAQPGAPKPPLPVATPAPAVAKPAGAKPKSDGKAGGLERAIAEGNVEIVQDKLEEDGNITHNVGHAKKAVYDAATGNLTLTGKPDVTTGFNTCISLDESTVIILNRAGQMKAIGPHKTTLRDASADLTNGR